MKAQVSGRVRSTDDFNRVHSNYEILEGVYSRRSLMAAKRLVNVLLDATGLGDSLKVWAEKAPVM